MKMGKYVLGRRINWSWRCSVIPVTWLFLFLSYLIKIFKLTYLKLLPWIFWFISKYFSVVSGHFYMLEITEMSSWNNWNNLTGSMSKLYLVPRHMRAPPTLPVMSFTLSQRWTMSPAPWLAETTLVLPSAWREGEGCEGATCKQIWWSGSQCVTVSWNWDWHFA